MIGSTKIYPREPERKTDLDRVFNMMHFGHANMLRQGDSRISHFSPSPFPCSESFFYLFIY